MERHRGLSITKIALDQPGEGGQVHLMIQHLSTLPSLHLDVLTVLPFAEIDEQTHTAETAMFFSHGAGILTVNGMASYIQETGLALIPRGCRSAIANSFSSSLHVLQVSEAQGNRVFPPFTIASLTACLQEDAFHQTWLDQDRVLPRLAQLDLKQHCCGNWGDLTLIELPPGARVESYTFPDAGENLFLVAGHLTVIAGGQRFDSEGGCGLNVFVPAGMAHRILNRSSIAPLVFLSMIIQNKEDQPCLGFDNQ